MIKTSLTAGTLPLNMANNFGSISEELHMLNEQINMFSQKRNYISVQQLIQLCSLAKEIRYHSRYTAKEVSLLPFKMKFYFPEAPIERKQNPFY